MQIKIFEIFKSGTVYTKIHTKRETVVLETVFQSSIFLILWNIEADDPPKMGNTALIFLKLQDVLECSAAKTFGPLAPISILF